MAIKQLVPKKTIAQQKEEQANRRTERNDRNSSQTSSQQRASDASYTREGSPEEREYLRNLIQQFGNVDSDYVDYVKKQQLYNANKAEMKHKFSGMNGIYHRQMILQCIYPLQEGISKDSLAQCIGMYVGMSLVSKDFRKQTQHMVRQAEYEVLSRKAEKTGPNSPAALKADKLHRQLTMYNNGGREPFSPRSAALTKIGMTMRAYSDMREPGANVEKIQREYREAIGVLNDQIGDDGMHVSAVNKEMRTIVGQMVNQNPEFANVFKELNYEGVTKAPYHSNPNNPNQAIWTGEYLDKNGKLFNGGFTPRVPLTVDSAADIKYNMAVDAYQNMRKDGADVGKVQAQYQENMRKFSELCVQDGLDEQVVNKKLRQNVGRMVSKDPSVNDIFTETAFGLVDKAPGIRDPENPNRAVWSGEYQTSDGLPFEGDFNPRPPMFEDMAAQLKIHLVMNAYDSMRNPGADVKACMQEYKTAMSALDKQCKVDKLDDAAINQSMRIMVGDMIEKNPAMAAMFKETTYDGVKRSSDFIDDSGQSHWTGEYATSNGVPFEGTFSPRMPHGYRRNMSDITSVVNREFSNVQDEHDLHDVMSGYSAAYYQVTQDKDPTDEEMQNPFYQDIATKIRMTMDDGGMKPGQFDKDLLKIFQDGYKSVPQDIVKAYKQTYASPTWPHSNRGYENDASGPDRSTKGRGSDVERRLGFGPGAGSENPGEEYNPG